MSKNKQSNDLWPCESDELFQGHSFFAGVDEVGRGPLAGPVVAAAVGIKAQSSKQILKLEQKLFELGIEDSKKVSEKKRALILKNLGVELTNCRSRSSFLFSGHTFYYAVTGVGPRKIDQLNILEASLFAMGKCIQKLGPTGPALVLVDGNKKPKLKNKNLSLVPLVKGDAKSACIALASIIAKQYRDHLMRNLDKRFPNYGFAQHAGYPTKYHYEQLKRWGPCQAHRLSFKGVDNEQRISC